MMEPGEYRHRQLYSHGGARDRITKIAALGRLGTTAEMAPLQVMVFADRPLTYTEDPAAVPPSTTSAPSTPGVSPVDLCGCLVSQVGLSTNTTDPAQISTLLASCRSNPALFAQTMQTNNISAGPCETGVPLEEPWYKKPANLVLLGGATILGLGLIVAVVK
jgi:hypothetical protein